MSTSYMYVIKDITLEWQEQKCQYVDINGVKVIAAGKK